MSSSAPTLSRLVDSTLLPLTGGISASAVHAAFHDWYSHLSRSVDEQAELMRKTGMTLEQWSNYNLYALRPGGDPYVDLTLKDKRFADPAWQAWPFNTMSQSFLLGERLAAAATSGNLGVSRHHAEVVGFVTRQWLDIFSPANYFWTNPQVLHSTLSSGGGNLGRGLANLLDDTQRARSHAPAAGTEAFRPGETVAVTPGKVIFRNRLIELIQYDATTDKVQPEPVLIIPAWIMKFYILDPLPKLVKYLVGQGHTVFMVSWLNPGTQDRDLGLEDYLDLGVMQALDAVGRAVPEEKVHAAGYCLGGTLLAIAAAAMARDGDTRLASMSLLAAQTDFSEPGQLSLFIDEAQIACLEQLMARKGYLDADAMAATFGLLNPADPLWSRWLADYLLGDRKPMSDLKAWNADGTRLPAHMHSQYLRHMYLGNDLAEGRFRVHGKTVSLEDLRCPVFCLGAEQDNVAPWQSVYKLHDLVPGPVTFVLTSGGHNGGIVNPPGVPRRSFHELTRDATEPTLDADAWLEKANRHPGSWWTYWTAWLKHRSGKPVAARVTAAGTAAPGSYVLQD